MTASLVQSTRGNLRQGPCAWARGMTEMLWPMPRCEPRMRGENLEVGWRNLCSGNTTDARVLGMRGVKGVEDISHGNRRGNLEGPHKRA
jgi:hypothetical protein